MSIKRKLHYEVLNELKKYDNDDEVQSMIHPDIDIMYNSVNIFLGHRGSGKTFNAFNTAALISRVKTKYHLFVYISNNPNDGTLRKFKPLIDLPTVVLPYEQAEEFIKELIDYKQAYDEIKFKHLENKITDECRDDIFEHLHINDFSMKSIHTLIVYDDAQEVFKKPSSQEFKWLLQNRQPKITYILNIQDWKGISPELKANIDSVWVFGGYARNRYCYIYNQLSCPVDRDTLYNFYSRLPKREALIFSYNKDGMNIKHLRDDSETNIIFSV